ncbi:Histidine kinase-, DNA gyrase B-, and HSP90-like ATPase [compost metagenome]
MRIIVADDGVGMPVPGTEPSEKPKKSGLGSQIVATLVSNELGGTIEWSDRPGGGTQVVLQLVLRDGGGSRQG